VIIEALFFQQIAQRRPAVWSAMAVAVKYEQVAFFQVDCWKRVWKLAPPLHNRFGIR
jgi:hypothetical protein